MKKTLATAAAVAMMLGLWGAGTADATPGPNGKNDKGLCTAYFNGSDTGRANKRGAPPFQGLEAAAEEAGVSVAEFCGATVGDDGEVTDPGPIGGNPDFSDPGEGNNNRGGKKP